MMERMAEMRRMADMMGRIMPAPAGTRTAERCAAKEEIPMLYVTDTPKDVATATRDLEEAVKRNKFGVLHVHDLQKTLKEKGVDFPNACRILEVCNPQRAVQVLTGNMGMNMALPCRISVYQDRATARSA
jgi:uncharacterized protein (DUF302 family)